MGYAAGAQAPPSPPRTAEVHFFVDQRFGRLGTQLKVHDDQESRFAVATPVKNADIKLYFCFCSF